MALVAIQDVHKAFGADVVFETLRLQLYAGEKVGMIGANGSGKSTILKLILGDIPADKGEIIRQKGLRIGYLPQEATFDGQRTVLEEMHKGVEHILALQRRLEEVSHELAHLHDAALEAKMTQYDRLTHEFELAGGYHYEIRIQTTLAGLEFAPEFQNVKTSALSGGQLSRLGLAQVLMLETDLLLLDEPTNHLDLQSTQWLESFISNYQGAAVVISHDRYLLDRIACKIIEVENRQARVWHGHYTNYMQTKETLRLQQEREHTHRQEMVERTLDFIARNKDQEGMRKTARGRKTRLRRLLKDNPDFLEKPFKNKTIHFSFINTDRQSDLALRCEGLSQAFGDLVLFENLTFDVLTRDRLGITGPNGMGKSTLLKLFLGQQQPSSGTVRQGHNLKIGYLDQHGDVLDPDKTVLDVALEANRTLGQEKARHLLGAFLLTDDDVFKRCRDLSGGQRNRLMLCKLVLAAPDILILDEPTNHLDIASREMLERALDDYQGTLIVVSHDRYFLDRVADTLLIMGTDEVGQRCPGRTEWISGRPVYSTYASLIKQRQEVQQQTKDPRASAPKKRRARTTKDKASPRTPEELKRFNKYSLAELEHMIMELEDKLAYTQERFGDETFYKNPAKLSDLQNTYDRQSADLELLYRAYERRVP